MSAITLPHGYIPRLYQQPIFEAVDKGVRRVLMVHGRRLGKDLTCFNLAIREAFKRVGLVLYLLPSGTMSRRIIMDGMTNEGTAFLDFIPEELISKVNKTDQTIHLINGSIIKLMGSEDYDRLRGLNPIMVVVSEAAYSHPEALEVVRPMLRMNNGVLVLNSTPAGKNWFYDLYEKVKDNKQWFVSFVNKDSAVDEAGNHYVTDDMVDEDRAEGMSEERIRSEYYCDFNANSEQYLFMKQLNEMENSDRMIELPYISELPVHTAFDLGISDATAIIYFQIVGGFINIIDYTESSGKGLVEYIKIMQEKEYTYGRYIAPHDIAVREFTTGKSRIESAAQMGVHFEVAPRLPVWDSVEAARQMLKYTRIDPIKCKLLINALINHQKEFDSRTQQYKLKPRHDWTSHGSDAYKTLAIGLNTRDIQESLNKGAKVDGYIQAKRRQNMSKPKSWKSS